MAAAAVLTAAIAGVVKGHSFALIVVMAMEYSEKVMEHFAHPHNVGVLDDANGVGEVGNAKCGDIMRMSWKSPSSACRPVKGVESARGTF